MKNKRGKPNKGNTKPVKAEEYKIKEEMELLPFLLQVMNKSRNSVKSILARGQVLVDGQVETAYNYQLTPGNVVSISNFAQTKSSDFIQLEILHEDEDLIVINKGAGLLSMASSNEKDLTAYRQLTDHVRKGHPKNRVFIVHRLDRDTSGVMMFTKNEAAKQKLQGAWKEMVKERTYLALVEGNVKKPEGTLSTWLKETRTMKMYSSPKPNDGQHAVTHYKVLQSNKNFSLLELQLETGRKNQIRVHMEDIGHPIVGDKKYGSRNNEISRLGLHANVLAFTHPTTGKMMRFEASAPESFWNKSK